ncbi:MAG: hypothetical protein ACI9BV_003331 [Rhodothermales bacterium]|jgi:hypothetical protein
MAERGMGAVIFSHAGRPERNLLPTIKHDHRHRHGFGHACKSRCHSGLESS